MHPPDSHQFTPPNRRRRRSLEGKLVRLRDQIQEVASRSDYGNRGSNTEELRVNCRETHLQIQELRRAERRSCASITDNKSSVGRPPSAGSETSGSMGETTPPHPPQIPPLVMDIDDEEATQPASRHTTHVVQRATNTNSVPPFPTNMEAGKLTHAFNAATKQGYPSQNALAALSRKMGVQQREVKSWCARNAKAWA